MQVIAVSRRGNVLTWTDDTRHNRESDTVVVTLLYNNFRAEIGMKKKEKKRKTIGKTRSD